MSDLTQRVQTQFGTHAQNYVNSHVHSSGYSLDRLIELLELQPDMHLLDIATGGGHVALAAARHGAKVIASDLTPAMLRSARQNITGQLTEAVSRPADYIQVNASSFPFADNALDRVTCRHAPHHFPNAEQFVREAVRVIRPGGMVGIVDQISMEVRAAAEYLNAFEKLRDPSHVWQYDQPTWESFFDLAGLQISHVEICQNRLEFGWWVKMQNCPPERVTRLEVLLRQAPKAVREWLQPELTEVGQPGAMYFSLWQIILVGTKR